MVQKKGEENSGGAYFNDLTKSLKVCVVLEFSLVSFFFFISANVINEINYVIFIIYARIFILKIFYYNYYYCFFLSQKLKWKAAFYQLPSPPPPAFYILFIIGMILLNYLSDFSKSHFRLFFF